MTLVGDEVLSQETGMSRPWWETRGWVLDAIVGLISAVLFLVFISEPQPVDPMIYLDTALDPDGAVVEHRSSRLGVVFPTWLVAQVFGHSEVTFYALPFVMCVVLAVATSNLGRAMFKWWVGPVAALLTVTSPFIFLYSAQLLPDIPATALSVASLAILFHATRRLPEQRSVLMVMAGVVFGLAFLMRETAVLFLPGLVAVALLWGTRWRGVLLVLAGALTGPILDLIGSAVIWGDPLARVDSVFRRTATSGHLPPEASEAAFAAQSNIFKTFSLLPELLWKSTHGRVILIGAALYLVTICLPRWRQRWLWGLPLWVLSAWVIFATVATIQPASGTPVLRLILDRYWAPFVPAIALMAVGWVALVTASLKSSAVRRTLALVGGVAGVLVVVSGISYTVDSRPSWFMRFGADGYWQLRETFRDLPAGTTLYWPTDSATLVGIYLHDPLGRPINDIAARGRESEDPDPGGFYIFHRAPGTTPETSDQVAMQWPPGDYELIEADDGLRWVVYAPQSENWDRDVLMDVGGHDAALGWQGRFIVDESWQAEMPFHGEVDLPEDTDMVVYDDSAAYASLGSDAAVFPQDSLVEVAFELDIVSGLTGVDCQFFPFDAAQERITVRAVAMNYATPISGAISWLCRTPDEIEGPFSVRPVLIVRGPAEMTVGEATVSAHYPAP